MCKQRQELERLCEKVGGCRVAKHKSGSGHFLIVGTDKDWSVTAPSTPSDWRGLKNMEAELRRRVHVEEDRTPDTDSLLFANLLLGQIIPDADQPRKDAEQTDLESLAASILKSGVLEPILVMPIDDKQYRIIAGERRFLAVTLALGLKDSPVAASSACQGYDFTRIPARIFAPMSKMDILRIQMTENLSREDMSQLDTGRALLKFVEAGLSMEKIARELGRSPSWVKGMLEMCSPEASEIAALLRLSLEDISGSDMLRMVRWHKDAKRAVILTRLKNRIDAGESFSRTMIDEEFERYNISSMFPSLSADDWSMKDLRMLEEFYTSQDAGKRKAYLCAQQQRGEQQKREEQQRREAQRKWVEQQQKPSSHKANAQIDRLPLSCEWKHVCCDDDKITADMAWGRESEASIMSTDLYFATNQLF